VLEGLEIPEKIRAGERAKLSFDWSVLPNLKKKVFFVSTLRKMV